MEHVILVAFQMSDNGERGREDAEVSLMQALQPVLTSGGGPAECWWVAEDDRHDGSDNDSAVFVDPGRQYIAASLLARHGLTAHYNIVEREVRGQFENPDERTPDERVEWLDTPGLAAYPDQDEE